MFLVQRPNSNPTFILLHWILVSVCFAAIGPVADLHLVNKKIRPDGFSRSTVLANGVFPGPLITAHKGETFKINVINDLTDDTMERSSSIHWHGIFQSGTNYNDGTGFVTQCPIVPFDSYEYKFNAGDQVGTYWYHSHVTTQYCDGLRGPLVIYDPDDPHAALYDVDDESTVITLSDWYHTPAPQVQLPFDADSTLINGLGRYPGGPASPLTVFNVEPGKRYRFRLIAMSCDSWFRFSIDGHNFTVIEVDGINVEPLLVDSIQLFTGQRYSIVFEANQEAKNYWLRAESPLCLLPGPSSGVNSAILRYAGAPQVEPSTPRENSVMPLIEINLHTLSNSGVPGEPYLGGADVTLMLHLDFIPTTQRFLMNGVSFYPPSVPVLLQVLSGARNASELLPMGSVFTLPRNKIVEISICAAKAAGPPHPFHLHGHAFDVVRSAGSSKYNYVNPVRRDVVSTGFLGDNVTIRFVTDNPGPWFLHCHIDWHLQGGLAVVFVEDTAGIAAHHDNVTHAWDNLCPKYNEFNDQIHN